MVQSFQIYWLVTVSRSPLLERPQSTLGQYWQWSTTLHAGNSHVDTWHKLAGHNGRWLSLGSTHQQNAMKTWEFPHLNWLVELCEKLGEIMLKLQHSIEPIQWLIQIDAMIARALELRLSNTIIEKNNKHTLIFQYNYLITMNMYEWPVCLNIQNISISKLKVCAIS